MRIQGTPGASQGIIIDGMTNLAGFLPGDFAEASVSPEAIQELNVYTGNVEAEHGRQGGGTLNFTLKSGANQPHGSVFYFGRNEALNANDWNNNRILAADPNFTRSETANFVRPKDRRNDWGFSGGGPVYIPKVYDGRNKSFFYFTLERFKTDTNGPAVAHPERASTGDLAGQPQPFAHRQAGRGGRARTTGIRRPDLRS